MKPLKYSLVTMLLFSASTMFAQSGTADEAWQKERYQDAADLYLKEHKRDTTNIKVIERLAKSNAILRNMEEAEGWYSLWFALDPSTDDQKVLGYAQVLAANKKYEQSKSWYSKYNELRPDDPRGERFVTAYGNLNQFYKDSTQWHLYYLALNTEADEYAPMLLDSSLVFSSNRMRSNVVRGMSRMRREPFSDLYLIKDRNRIEEVVLSQTSDTLEVSRKRTRMDQSVASSDNKPLNTYNTRFYMSDNPYFTRSTKAERLPIPVNGPLNDGASAFDPSTRIMFYTRSQMVVDSSNVFEEGRETYRQLKLSYIHFENGKWYNRNDFDFTRGDYSTTQPAFGEEGKILFFASDMPGGFGGMDIYYSLKEDTMWTQPVNMGPLVNTKGNDEFPFVDGNNLYFASNGWGGLGGLDIFMISINGTVAGGQVKNLGYPVNSSSDDYGFILEKRNRGYFCSNRLRSDDIYRFEK